MPSVKGARSRPKLPEFHARSQEQIDACAANLEKARAALLARGKKPNSFKEVDTAMKEVVLTSGITPITYLAAVLRDPGVDMRVRVQVAAMMLPYLHSKAPVTIEGNADRPVVVDAVKATRLDRLTPDELGQLELLMLKAAGVDDATLV